MGVTISELQARVAAYTRTHGWHDPNNKDIPGKLMMVNCELSEAMEDYRNSTTDEDLRKVVFDGNKPNGFPTELADAIIRILAICDLLDINIEDVLLVKQAYNETRPYRHGGKRA